LQTTCIFTFLKKSSCSRHDAVNLSNAKPNRGHTASGVGKVVCSRHGMNLPNSVGDLQVGERWATKISEVLFFSWRSSQILQYGLLILQNIDGVHEERTILCCILRHCLPVVNSSARVDVCFRPRFLPLWQSQTCQVLGSEVSSPCAYCTPERTWNETNPLATSTREMGPGSQRDVLDYHFGDHNWRKLILLGKIRVYSIIHHRNLKHYSRNNSQA
jgi:hypothetical protein